MLLRVLYIALRGVEGIQWYDDVYRQDFYEGKKARECFGTAMLLTPEILHPIKDFADIYSDDITNPNFSPVGDGFGFVLCFE